MGCIASHYGTADEVASSETMLMQHDRGMRAAHCMPLTSAARASASAIPALPLEIPGLNVKSSELRLGAVDACIVSP